jgi:hypothetical protein
VAGGAIGAARTGRLLNRAEKTATAVTAATSAVRRIGFEDGDKVSTCSDLQILLFGSRMLETEYEDEEDDFSLILNGDDEE